MFQISRRVGMYEQLPFLYSPAYHNFVGHFDVCYPIGIHWIVRLVRNVWSWTLRHDLIVKEAAEAWKAGFNAGYATGFRDGTAAGVTEGQEKFRMEALGRLEQFQKERGLSPER